MSQELNTYSLSELRGHTISEYRTGGGTRPDVLVIELNGQQAVLKDHNRCAPWFARIVAPILTWREAKALSKLQGLEGVPVLLSRPDRRSLLMEHLPGSQILKHGNNPYWDEYFRRLSDLIGDMHTRGVAHCDLRSPTNVLVTKDNRPVVVDFVACFCAGSKYNIVANSLFRQLARVDRSAEVKLKRHVAPGLISEEDVNSEHVGGKAGQFFRRLGSKIRDVTRSVFASDRRGG